MKKTLLGVLEDICFREASVPWFGTNSITEETFFREKNTAITLQNTPDANVFLDNFFAMGTYTPLMSARNAKTICKLRDYKLDVNMPNSFGITALDFHESCVKISSAILHDILESENPKSNYHFYKASAMQTQELEVVAYLKAIGAKNSLKITNATTNFPVFNLNTESHRSDIIEVFAKIFLNQKCSKKTIETLNHDSIQMVINAVENGRALDSLNYQKKHPLLAKELENFEPIADDVPNCLQDIITAVDGTYVFYIDQL